MRILFDDDCGLCILSVRRLARRSEGIVFAPLDTPEESVVAELDDGSQLRGGAVVAAALRHCGGMWPIAGRILTLPGVSVVAAASYRCVAARRRQISRLLGWEACPVR